MPSRPLLVNVAIGMIVSLPSSKECGPAGAFSGILARGRSSRAWLGSG